MSRIKVWNYPIQAVVFDVDGTILDSIKHYYEANKIMSGDPNFPFSFQKKLSRFSGDGVAKEIIKEYHLKMTPKEFLQKRRHVLHDLLPASTFIPGVEHIVRTIYDMDIPMAVGTSAWSCNHKMKISKHQEFFSLFSATVCGDDVKQVKPSPDIFQIASKKLGNYKPENVLVFEDSINGIKAANNAKMPCVFLCDDIKTLSNNISDDDFYPTLTIHNYKEFSFDSFTWKS